MNRSRTYFSVFVAVTILVVSFYFSWTFFSKKETSPTQLSKIVSTGNVPRFAETNAGSIQSTVNITRSVVDDFGAEFYKRISELDVEKRDDLLAQIKAGNGNVFSPESVDAQQIVKKLSPDVIGVRNSVTDEEIKLDSGTDLDAYRKRYLLAMTDVQLLVSQVDPVDALNLFVNKGDSSGLDSMITAYQNAYSALREVAVPKEASEFHAKSLLYLSNSVSVYSALRQYYSDPLRAYVALEYMGSLVSLWNEIYRGVSS